MSSIFSNLKSLGFDKVDDLKIYTKKDKPKRDLKNTNTPKKEIDINTLLYDKKVHCPVCSHDFTARTVKVSAPRIESKDSDFFIRYYVINPYFYDVWVCPVCGYSAMKVDFPKIRSFQLEFIRNKISTQWKGRNYPSLYDEEIAIEKIDGPIGLAIDSEENIYIANYNKHNILKVDKNGAISELIGNIQNPYCMYITDGLLFISSQGSNSVIRYKLKR